MCIRDREIAPAIIASARLFTDDTANCASNGEIERGLAEGAFGLDHVLGELGDVLVGKVPGRTSAEDVTVFDSAGTALFDIACAKIALDAAARQMCIRDRRECSRSMCSMWVYLAQCAT